MAKRSSHGPGNWVCWACFEIVSNHPDFKPKMRFIDTGPPSYGLDYRAKINAPCKRCGNMIYVGQLAQKLTLDAPLG